MKVAFETTLRRGGEVGVAGTGVGGTAVGAARVAVGAGSVGEACAGGTLVAVATGGKVGVGGIAEAVWYRAARVCSSGGMVGVATCLPNDGKLHAAIAASRATIGINKRKRFMVFSSLSSI
jgi:predicted Rossmann-fold nucleotide-binding protein